MIKKTLNKQELERNYLDIIKAICENLRVNIVHNGESLNLFF